MDVENEIWGSEATSPRLGRERDRAGPEDHSGEDMRSGRKTYLGGCRHRLLAGPDRQIKDESNRASAQRSPQSVNSMSC